MTRIAARLPISLCLALAAGPAGAQIKTDDTLGRAARALHGPHYAIGPDLGRITEQNLFHSFERFNLRTRADGTVESATFTGPDQIRNIISRVTGGEASDINGTIKSMIPGADFYFINPAGVVFGPHAGLDVQGSFHVSTADELRLADGKIFSAANPAASSFSVEAPEAFGFLDRGAKGITVNRAELLVAPEETLSLVGGDLTIDRGVIALRDFETQNGNVTLVAMSRAGAVGVSDGRPSAAPEGGILISGGGVDLSSEAGGGVVRIRAGALTVDSGAIIADNGGGEPGVATALIDIEADRTRLTRGAQIGSVTIGGGNAGDVTVRTGELDVLSGALLSSETAGAGNAGAVSVLGARRVLVAGEGRTEISSTAFATGDAGTVTVEANEVTVRGFLKSISSTTREDSPGDAGDVVVRADHVALLAGGQISTSTLDQSVGNGGNVTVTVHEELAISGQSKVAEINPRTNRPEPSGIFASTESDSADAGRAGNASVTAPAITITDRGEISSESFNAANGGKLKVRATDRLVIDAGEISTEATGAGAAGAIRIRAGALELRNVGSIHSNAEGTGGAGAVRVEASGRLFLLEGSEVSTESAAAGGGRIRLLVGDTIVLRDSEVITSVAGGEDPTAGNVLIDPKVLVIDGSRIQANAPAGFGGRVRIVADNILVPGSNFQALLDRDDISATGGDPTRAGTIVVNAPEVDLSGGLVVLEGALLDAASQLRERCAARRDIGASSFTGVGRGGLPPGPDAPLAGAYLGRDAAGGAAWERAAIAPPKQARSASGTRVVAALAPCVAWPEAAMNSP